MAVSVIWGVLFGSPYDWDLSTLGSTLEALTFEETSL